ncbi:MAG TPA: TAT-variant-translocated molybdopterin oxidoreductase [Thermoanaerobaculia bacterium]|nr:TAT-variant-translocated molybdopterin oxidoreductase [Thermoanaerobaculia bacterium]
MAKSPKGKCGAKPSRPATPATPATPANNAVDVEALRRRFAERRGPELWRSLDELAGTPEFEELLHREFPRHASEWVDTPKTPAELDASAVSRRAFLQLAGASLALAGMTGCTRQPLEKIVPYVRQPEQLIPGRPLFFATTLTLSGYGTGVLAESHEGRPTKIEGNPDHPASLGSTDIFAQAAVLDLYDPARSQQILHLGRVATSSAFLTEITALMAAKEARQGEGMRLLTGAVTSPTFAAQIEELAKRFPKARWHRWEAAGSHHQRAAARLAFGKPLDCRYDLSRADVIVTFDADLLASGPGAVVYARQFADRRRVRENSSDLATKMNRLYAVESTPTSTGTVADHRLRLPPAELEAFLAALAGGLGVAGLADGPGTPNPMARPTEAVDAIAEDLKAHAGSSLVVAGEFTSPAAQLLAHALNQALGNVGKTVFYSDPVEVDPVDHRQSLAELVRDMRAGQVDLLVMLGGVNPVFTAPADLEFAEALKKVALLVHHGLYEDETAAYCHWHLPAAHALESWGDARAFDGTASFCQPLIEPLYDGKTAHEVLALLLGHTASTGYELVRAAWAEKLGGDFEAAFRKALHDGVIAGTGPAPAAGAVAVPAAPPPIAGAALTQAAAEIAAAAAAAGVSLVAPHPRPAPRLALSFRPDPTIHDGSYAANVWLQELPKPLTKLTWDNAVLISPATFQRLRLEVNGKVEIEVAGRKLLAAVWVLPGQADDTLTLSLGYGRRRAGENGSGRGFNAYVLRTADALWLAPAASLRAKDDVYVFACTQNHHLLEWKTGIKEDILAGKEEQERNVVRTATVAEFGRDPEFAHARSEAPPRGLTLYPNREYKGHSWGMAIDLNVCTGCSACVVACQAENNVPVVGKEQVLKHREMHWIRIDRYFTGSIDEPQIHNQPVPCMQCENAPCEVVCPVGATSHSDEGLNDMTYNRCVGTRYCSNNCPYKVRRFNFLRYSDPSSPLIAMVQNPDVTVRMHGVMEKCTYCVQRIEHAKIDSKVTGQPIQERSLKTACQQACPTQAIVFGDLNAGKSGELAAQPPWEVAKWKASPLNYGLLEELNTRPRTTYLAKVTNPNPRLAAPASARTEERT